MKKVTLSDVVASDTPYLDTFGVENRPKGRPSGAFIVYETSLELPSIREVPDRDEATAIRAKVKAKALAVVQAVMAEEVKKIYQAELALELARRRGAPAPAEPKTIHRRRKLLSDDEAKSVKGSGLLPGETYWDWMKTMVEKDEDQWASEKVTVKSNLERIKKGGHRG